MIVMVSDGSPANCSVASLNHLVTRLGHEYDIACVHVAIDRVGEVEFPYQVDLYGFQFDAAVARFGALIAKMAARWG